MIDGEKHSLNAGNLTDCADIMISDDAADELIATTTNAGDSADFFWRCYKWICRFYK